MTIIAGQILDGLVTTLTGISGVDVVIDDPARLVTNPDGVALMIEWEEAAGGVDSEPDVCVFNSYLPVLITIYSPRAPGDAPFWQVLGPIYAEVHRRMMADRRRGGLAMDTTPISRTPESGAQGCALLCRYSVQYRTLQGDVELQ